MSGCMYLCKSHDGYSEYDFLPRVSVDVHTEVQSTAYKTKVTQVFVNSTSELDISECAYQFPLFDGVSVVKFECVIGNRRIHGVVKEKAEAREVYEEAVARDEFAGLLEQDQTSDLFSTHLGNIPAGANVHVELEYVGELSRSASTGGIRYVLPTSISARYGWEETSKTMNPVQGSGLAVVVDVSLPKNCAVQHISSPSHPIAVNLGKTSSQPDETSSLCRASATLSLDDVSLDSDFVLEIVHTDDGQARAILETHPHLKGYRALMTTLRLPPQCPTPTAKPEIIIIADQSGSMAGSRTTLLKSALKLLLKSLSTGIKFNIVAFGSVRTFCWDTSSEYNLRSLKRAIKFVDGFDASHGGTETMGALRAAISSRDVEKDLAIFLATDGDIWQQEEFFDYIKRRKSESKTSINIFPLGIGSGASTALIEGTARAGEGFAQYVVEGEKLDTKVVRMLKAALAPKLAHLTMEVKYHNQDEDFEIVERVSDSLVVLDLGDKGDDFEMVSLSEEEPGTAEQEVVKARPVSPPKLLQTPPVIPPLYASQQMTVYLLMSPDSAQKLPQTVTLHNKDERNAFEMVIPVEILDDRTTVIHSLAAKRAIRDLEEGRGWLEYAENGRGSLLKKACSHYSFDDKIKQEAVRLGVAFGITGKHTSSVAVLEGESCETNQMWHHHHHHPPRHHPYPRYPNCRGRGGGRGGYPGLRGGGGGRGGGVRGGHQQPLGAYFCSFRGSPPRSSSSSTYDDPASLSGLYSSRGHDSRMDEDSRFISAPRYPSDGLRARAMNAIGAHNSGHGGTLGMTEAMATAPDEDDSEKDKEDVLDLLIKHQCFNGAWNLDDAWLSKIETCTDDLRAAMPVDCVSPAVWATLVAISFLENVLSKDQERWELIVEKAKDWLAKTLPGRKDDVDRWRAEAYEKVTGSGYFD